jgi:hypothetical protein
MSVELERTFLKSRNRSESEMTSGGDLIFD